MSTARKQTTWIVATCIILIVVVKEAQSTTTRSYYNGTPSLCPWPAQADRNTLGGQAQSSITTIPDCQSACSNAGISACQGIDWDPNSAGAKCYFSTTPTTSYSKGVTHYDNPAIKDSQCSQSGTPPPGCYWSASSVTCPSGILVSYSYLPNCQQGCLSFSTPCYGVDWNANTQQCWFSLSGQTAAGQPGVTHFTYVCGGNTVKLSGTVMACLLLTIVFTRVFAFV